MVIAMFDGTIDPAVLAAFDVENDECDEFMHRMRGQDPVCRPQPAEPVVPVLSGTALERWNSWCDRRVETAIDKFDEDLAGIHNRSVEEVNQIVAELDSEIASLRDEIAGLRTDLAVTSAIARGEIKELKAKANDAA
jgi:hypothetical protein